jgi:hypothetical protein
MATTSKTTPAAPGVQAANGQPQTVPAAAAAAADDCPDCTPADRAMAILALAIAGGFLVMAFDLFTGGHIAAALGFGPRRGQAPAEEPASAQPGD